MVHGLYKFTVHVTVPALIQRRRLTIHHNFEDFPPSPLRDRLLDATDLVPLIAAYVLSAPQATFNYVFDKYFLPQHYNAVTAILQNLQNEQKWENILISGTDDYNLCIDGRKGYVANVIQDGCFLESFLHICHTGNANGYEYPSIRDLRCSMLGSDLRVSYRMLTFEGWVVLHEFMHMNEITAAEVAPFNPPKGFVEDVIYGQKSVRNLRNGPDAYKAIYNADSLALFVVELYFTKLCKPYLQQHGLVYFRDPVDDSQQAFHPPGTP
ncbi:uncharacterized protein N7459_000002 [Penicillium hispanicum]|uniref:uncharacterized protein n=1 Tax=Penicillium hispanicum TaxID=1080232 RepID=UPI0025423439|nr:uncharacterized protein N7459_000002 [Penicillium hispanicum]KAJ5593794.1 hypothetical protein N7459_000002 [Penicillium hispanicum]